MTFRCIKSIYVAFLISIIFLLGCKNSFNNTDQLMEYYEENGRKEIGSPFSGAVLISKKGKIVLKQAYGFSNRELKIPNTVDSKFPIGSITKQFTAMLIMQMVEKERLHLNDTIHQHLPYLKSQWSKEVTIHQLLSHTSGLPHYEGIIGKQLDRESFSKTAYTSKQLALLIDNIELSYPTNTKFYYSSLGYLLLGTILEEITQQSYAELLSEYITTPLNLKNTGFASNEFIANQTAKGYSFVEDETFKMIFMKYGGEFREVPFRDQSNKFSTGGIHSTVEDLFIWSEAIKNYRLLSKKYTDKMLLPNKDGYCYGWFRNWDELIERNKNVKMYTHGGTLSGHNSSINIFDDGTTIIYLANTNNIKTQELTHQLYLTTHQLKDSFRLKGYPNRSSLAEFEKEGGITALNNYFDELSERCGYKVLPSENSIAHIMLLYYKEGNYAKADSLKQAFFTNFNPTETAINRMGYNLLENNCNIALMFFKENTLRHPKSPNVWDSYAEGLMNCGQRDEAINSYKTAVALAEKCNHKNLNLFKKNLSLAIEKRID